MSNRNGLASPRGTDGAAWATTVLASRKQSQRIRFENRGPLWVCERELEELVDVLPQILHAGTRPIRAPQRAVGDLRQAGKALQHLGRRNPPAQEPNVASSPGDQQ